MSLGAWAVLLAMKLKPSREKEYPGSAVIVKTSASPAAACDVAAKKLLAPLIWAALSKPVEEVNELKLESVVTLVTVIPAVGVAPLVVTPAGKLKLARVAA